MRIIAGTHRGRPIIAPAGVERTRPITDRVKQSLFDRLMAQDRIEGAVVADIFAGTGSMGLECVSRGASHVTFVELDRDAAVRLKKNLAALKLRRHEATLIRQDALGRGWLHGLGDRRFSLIFVDPPYPMMRHPTQGARVLRQIDRLRDHATEDALLVVRTPSDVPMRASERWPHIESHDYKSMTVHLLSG